MSTSSQGEGGTPRPHFHGIVGGTFLFFLAIYLLSGPGRIDTIDGQFRYEVARNLVEQGRPIVRDGFLTARVGVDGARYSYYGLPASLISTPLVWLGHVLGGNDGELARFLFSFTSAFFAAGSLALLVHFWRLLGFSPRRAFGWAAVVGLGSLLWPVATSVFDQAQHAFFVLASVYCGFRATEKAASRTWPLLSGLCAGVLLLYQIPYVVFSPILALSMLDRATPARVKLALPRLIPFTLVLSFCLVLWGTYNFVRFGSPTDTGALPGHPLWGNPLIGLLGLTISPGKGILWYSPLVVLQIWALPSLWRTSRVLALVAVTMGVGHLLFIASIIFHGGDWCWGPRYLVTTLPLMSLGLPFLPVSRATRWVGRSIVAVGAIVQVLAISMDHQGFFFAHSLKPWFWTDPWSCFRRSQLAYRVKELSTDLDIPNWDGRAPFRPGPYPSLVTYAIFGPPPSLPTAQYPAWMQPYPVFQLPRPWPLWMRHLPSDKRPAPVAACVLAMGGMLLIGAWRIRQGMGDRRPGKMADPPSNVTLADDGSPGTER